MNNDLRWGKDLGERLIKTYTCDGLGVVYMGGDNKFKQWWYKIEETMHWINFWDKQQSATRKEITTVLKHRVVQKYRYNEYFARTLKRNLQMRKAMEIDKYSEDETTPPDPTIMLRLKEMEDTLNNHRLFDAFLSKRVTERYREINDLHQTRYAIFDPTYPQYYNSRLLSVKTEVNRLLWVGGVVTRKEGYFKWRRILESWNASSGCQNESKSDTKKSSDSARPTHVNECGI